MVCRQEYGSIAFDGVRLLIAADLLNALLMLSVPVAWFLGVLRLEQLYVVTFLSGMLTVLFRVAHQSLMPSVVQREHIVEANAKLGLSGNVAEITAPGAGGLLVQAISAPLTMLLDGCSFLVSAFLIWRFAPPSLRPYVRRSGNVCGTMFATVCW